MTRLILSDDEKITIALKLQALRRKTNPAFTVWLDGGTLRARELYTGEPVLIRWGHAADEVSGRPEPPVPKPAPQPVKTLRPGAQRPATAREARYWQRRAGNAPDAPQPEILRKNVQSEHSSPPKKRAASK